jgi:DNA replication and repair protein RecF
VNGSGKTSLLEGAHLLAMARSFRTGAPKTLITHGEESCIVFGERRLPNGRGRGLGVSRRLDGSVEVHIAGERVRSLATLADELPLLLINAESFELLVGQPQQRRRFIDWGVFHVEHEFRDHWQRFQRALTQRNHLLRRGRIDPSEIAPWDRDLVRHGEAISGGRQRFLDSLRNAFAALMAELAPELGEIDLRYRRGWDSELGYAEVLARGLGSDREQGFTQSGPQRADLKVSVAGNPAAATLSRGQQKLVVCALKLAQGQVLAQYRRDPGVFLVDDLPAELDVLRCERVCRALARTGAQTYMTCVDRNAINPGWLEGTDPEARSEVDPKAEAAARSVTVFHVEQGEIAPIASAASSG